jgi:hypothetical protein
MATSLHFSAASPPLWPCGDPHHSSVVPLDTAAPQDDAPGARSGEVLSTIDFAAVRYGRSGRGSCVIATANLMSRFGCSYDMPAISARILRQRRHLAAALITILHWPVGAKKAAFFFLFAVDLAWCGVLWLAFGVFYALVVKMVGC